MNKKLNEINKCEVCGGIGLERVLDLGLHPMCDDLVPVNEDRSCTEYPIEILFCHTCRTAHQRYQVPKELLFPQTYHYRSRHTADVLSGMGDLVDACEKKLGNLSGKKILDIGCNDGSLLSFFRQKGASIFGIEPTGAYLDAKHAGVTVIHDYLTEEVVKVFVSQYGSPDLIVFTNVFAHIEDLGKVLRSLQILRHAKTAIMIENHYLGSIFKRKQFDTFYHEHPRTYSYGSFVKIAESLDMEIGVVEFPSRYGGNIRVLLQPSLENIPRHHRFEELSSSEEIFRDSFFKLEMAVKVWHDKKKEEIENAVKLYGPLVAKAFPGRSAIPLKMLNLDHNSISAIYEKPASGKIGHYAPGTRIPIISDESILQDWPKGSPILNLAWHIDEEITAYMRQLGYTGGYINII